jgi:hypothetical protein
MSEDRAALPFGFDEYEAPPRRRRRTWPWIVTLLIVVALIAGAAVGAEALARGAVQGGVRQLVVMQLDLPADQPVDVEVDGLVLPQLLSGRLGEITVASPDATLGPVAGDVEVTLTDVPISADAAAGPGSATVRLDEAQLQGLLGTIEGFPAESVAISEANVTVSTELSLFGASFPLGVALQPGAAGGNLTMTPTAFQLGGTDVSADALRTQFGGLADTVLREWSVCVAENLPAALTLISAATADGAIVATFDIDGAVIIDPALRQPGTCP